MFHLAQIDLAPVTTGLSAWVDAYIPAFKSVVGAAVALLALYFFVRYARDVWLEIQQSKAHRSSEDYQYEQSLKKGYDERMSARRRKVRDYLG